MYYLLFTVKGCDQNAVSFSSRCILVLEQCFTFSNCETGQQKLKGCLQANYYCKNYQDRFAFQYQTVIPVCEEGYFFAEDYKTCIKFPSSWKASQGMTYSTEFFQMRHGQMNHVENCRIIKWL